MSMYTLISLGSDGTEQSEAIDPRYLLVIEAEAGVSYRVVNSETGQAPGLQRLHRREGDLLIEGDGDALVRIIGFFSVPLQATYQATDELVIDAEQVGSEESGDGVVWDAVDGGGVCFFAAAAVAAGAAASSSSGSAGAGAGGGSAGAAGAGAAGAAGASSGVMASIASAVASNVGVAAAAAAAAAAATAAAIAEDDPDQGVLNIVPVAGPFTGNANIALYDQNGEQLLLEVVEHNFGNAPFMFTLPENYLGPLLVVISEANGYEPDFIDEATGEARNLGGSLRAIVNVTDASERQVSITPLTELAVRVADIEAGETLTVEDLVANTRIGEIFGVEDITAVVTDIFNENYDETDGLNGAEHYGQLLASISGVATGSDLSYAIDQLQSYIEGSADDLEVDQQLFVVLREAAEFFEAGVNAELAAVTAVSSPVAPRIAATQLPQLVNGSVVNRDFLEQGVTIDVDLDSIAAAGDVVTLYWGAQSLDYTLTSEDVVAATISLQVEQTLILQQGNGAIEVAVAFDGVQRPLTTIVDVDVDAPVLQPLEVSYSELRSAESTLGTVTQPEGNIQLLDGWAFVDSDAAISGDGFFQIDPTGKISLTAEGLASPVNDYESLPNNFYYQIKAKDNNGNWSAPVSVSFSVADVNEPPTALTLTTLANDLTENTDTATRIKLADIVITDDALGNNSLTLSDTAHFEIFEGALYLKADVELDYEALPSLPLTVTASDSSAEGSTAATANYVLNISDVNEAPASLSFATVVTELSEDSDTSVRIKLADIAITDDALGNNSVTLSNASHFEVIEGVLYLKAGASLNYEALASHSITVSASDSTVEGSATVTANYTLAIADVNEAPTALNLENQVNRLPFNADTSVPIRVADISIVDDALGNNVVSLSGVDQNLFEVIGDGLYLSSGTILDDSVQSEFNLTVDVRDESLSSELSEDFSLTLAPPEVYFNLSSANFTVGDITIASGQSSSIAETRSFQADTSYSIYIVVNSSGTSWTGLDAEAKWDGVSNLGPDDKIILTTFTGGIINVVAGRDAFDNAVLAELSGSQMRFSQGPTDSWMQHILVSSSGNIIKYVDHYDHTHYRQTLDLWQGAVNWSNGPLVSLSANALV